MRVHPLTGRLLAGAAMLLSAPALAQAMAGTNPAGTTYRADRISAERRAAATESRMSAAERTVLTAGIMPLPYGKPVSIPADAVPGAGYVAGIPRLGIPALRETDASLGVAYLGGIRKDGATALPSGMAMASSWNPALLYQGGRMIGAEARAKGFNVLLAGGVNLMRDPRNGRTFEYLGEDPLLAGVLGGAAISGVQSNHIISTIKHFALNDQETGRRVVNAKIGEAAARESDLLAFQIGIERGDPGAVMCAYNRVNGAHACDSDWLLNGVLKRDWRYRGFVMSDWGAVPGPEAALHGLDQQSGAQLDAEMFLAKPLADAARDPAYAARVRDMNRRVLTAIYANGLDRYPVVPGGGIDFAADARIAEEVARQGIVLLRNERGALPLARSARRIAVIGGYADGGVLSGSGSSQVQGESGPAVSIPLSGTGQDAFFLVENYHRSSPLAAIKAMAPQADVRFSDGRYIGEAAAQAKAADVAIVFATQWASEKFDLPDLSLPDGQDALIEAVAAANPNTIVVLETGGPVAMPWLDKTAGVLEAWYPGARGGQAIASILFGETNPSGRLPVTFPMGTEQLPRPRIDGGDIAAPVSGDGTGYPPAAITADYDIEGSDVGYRWYARNHLKPLFPFGFGLSYTQFATSGFRTDGRTATFSVRNSGARAGAMVAQVYLVSRDGEAKRRLVGFQRVELAAGGTRQVRLEIDPRLLADWTTSGWSIRGGSYTFAFGKNAEQLSTPVKISLPRRTWRDSLEGTNEDLTSRSVS